MTSSKKKHHPRPVTGARPTPKQVSRTEPRSARPALTPRVTTRRQWVIRVIAVLGIVVGLGMVLVGATPGIVDGWGKILLMVPGAVIIAGSFAAFVETTSRARSLRRRE